MPRSRTSLEALETRIHTIRGSSVLLDSDLAALYGVTPSALMQAVRRNGDRFPPDFMFQLINQEVTNLKSQSVISSLVSKHGGRRVRPDAFTEQGVAMLSSVLRSETAVQVNIEIVRAFVRLRRAKVASHDQAIKKLVASIRMMMAAPPEPERRGIGFTSPWK